MDLVRPRPMIVALAAVAALSACSQDGAGAGQEPDESPATTASETTGSADGSGGEPLALVVDTSTAGRCAVPSAQTLATFDTAFAGTVTSLGDGTATLDVDEWYAGGDGASTVTVATPGEQLRDLLMAVDFTEGETYLVTAKGDRVTLCGFTAEQTPDLQALYDEAFAG